MTTAPARQTMVYRTIDSPIGPLLLAADGEGVRVLAFAGGSRAHAVLPDWQPDRGALDGLVAELDAYFAGGLKAFSTVLAPAGTAFQQSVWKELRQIRMARRSATERLRGGLATPGRCAP